MKLELKIMLKKTLTRLYAKILIHLARAVRFFDEKSINEFHFLILFIFFLRAFAVEKKCLCERIILIFFISFNGSSAVDYFFFFFAFSF